MAIKVIAQRREVNTGDNEGSDNTGGNTNTGGNENPGGNSDGGIG